MGGRPSRRSCTAMPSRRSIADAGGIVAVVPGQMAIVGFAPPLDKSGNSVRGAKAISYIVGRFGLNLFGAGK